LDLSILYDTNKIKEMSSTQELNQEIDIPVTSLSKTIDITPFKQFVLKLPNTSTFRNVILSEKDTMTTQEFLAKIKTWLALARLESI
jgi:hypothetical protein